jgi:uncharacterized protein (TIRG00374 family)
MSPQTKKTAITILRWAVAVAGVWWVLAKTSFQDRVLIVDPQTHQPKAVRVFNDAKDSDSRFEIYDPDTDPHTRWVPRDQVWIKPDGSTFQERLWDGKLAKLKLLAVLSGDESAKSLPARLIVSRDGRAEEIDPAKVPGVYTVSVPYPRVDIGLSRLVWAANPWYLAAALAVLPISFLITARRWHMLLGVLDINIGQAKTFVICMVSAFYGTFMPGSTGGDVVKAYYAAKHTIWRTRAVLSVLIDRALGLLALVILGGIMASLQLSVPDCRRIAIACGAMLAATVIGAFVFYHPHLRKVLGVDWLLARLPLQKQVASAVEAMHLYGRRPWIPIWAIIMTFPVHITSIISAYFAGRAFGLHLHFFYYWVAVPVIVLVGAIPISPQGAGVMEFRFQGFRVQGVRGQEMMSRPSAPERWAFALAAKDDV